MRLTDNFFKSIAIFPTSSLSWFFTSNVCFVYFYNTRQPFSPWAYHGDTKLMEHYPYCFVSLKPQSSLKPQGAYAVFLINNIPYQSEPKVKRVPGILKYRTSSYRSLISTLSAMIQFALC